VRTGSVSQPIIAITVLAAAPLAALPAAIWWLWWRLPKRQLHGLDTQIHDPKARADTEDNFRKTVGQALGGIAVLIGAGAAYLQFTQQQRTATEQIITQQKAAADQIAAQQKIAADQIAAQMKASENQQQGTQDLLISNQVGKGFEQLARDKIAMRLGGIYALEGVMNTFERYHGPVLEALCAFVRESTQQKVAAKSGKGTSRPPPATDVPAALTAIGRRKQGPGQVDLAKANLSGADLAHADLSHAILRDAALRSAHLSNIDLTGADLSAADLSGPFLDKVLTLGVRMSGRERMSPMY
jgi:hypothetical protein